MPVATLTVRQHPAWNLFVVGLALFCILWLSFMAFGADSGLSWPALLLFAGWPWVFMFFLTRRIVRVDETGIDYIRPPWPRRRIAWGEIESVGLRASWSSFTEVGGYRLEFRGGKRTVSISASVLGRRAVRRILDDALVRSHLQVRALDRSSERYLEALVQDEVRARLAAK